MSCRRDAMLNTKSSRERFYTKQTRKQKNMTLFIFQLCVFSLSLYHIFRFVHVSRIFFKLCHFRWIIIIIIQHCWLPHNPFTYKYIQTAPYQSIRATDRNKQTMHQTRRQGSREVGITALYDITYIYRRDATKKKHTTDFAIYKMSDRAQKGSPSLSASKIVPLFSCSPRVFYLFFFFRFYQ